jgi:hypothetical protein
MNIRNDSSSLTNNVFANFNLQREEKVKSFDSRSIITLIYDIKCIIKFIIINLNNSTLHKHSHIL